VVGVADQTVALLVDQYRGCSRVSCPPNRSSVVGPLPLCGDVSSHLPAASGCPSEAVTLACILILTFCLLRPRSCQTRISV